MLSISAQVSLYPLRQPRVTPAIDECLHVFQAYRLEIQPGPMSTLVVGEHDAIFDSLKAAFCQAAAHGEVVMVVTLSNACPAPGRRPAQTA